MASARTTAASAAPDVSAQAHLVQQLLKGLESVPNIRDLAGAAPGAIQPGRLIRCARPMGACEADVGVLVDRLRIRDLVDLRSPQELEEDGEPPSETTPAHQEAAAAGAAAGGATPGSGAAGGTSSNGSNGSNGSAAQPASGSTVNGSSGIPAALPPPPSSSPPGGAAVAPIKRRVARFHALQRSWLTGQVALPQLGGAPPDGPLLHHRCSLLEKSRFYVSLLSRLPWATSGQAVALAVMGFREASRNVLVRVVNTGGLALLYRILVDSARPEILAVLQLITASLERRRPVLFFCRAGKDRTGVVAMLLLSIAGASKEAILDDYVKSESYHKVALAGLEDKKELRGLDRSVFEGAPGPAMADCVAYIEQQHGSVEVYLTRIGFGPDRQRRLRQLMTEPWTVPPS